MEQIASLLAEAAELSRQAAALAGEGKVTRALELEEKADQLRRRARNLAAHAVHPDIVAVRPGPGENRSSDQVLFAEVKSFPGPAVRQVAIDSLNEIGVPVAPRAVAEYAWARFDAKVDYTALASLRRDERRAWDSPRSHRPVYIIPALEGRHFFAMRGKIALSVWSLEQRIIGPWSERVDHLTATVNLARHLAWLVESDPAVAERVREVVVKYAATIPGALDGSELVDPRRVEASANAELEALAPRDREWRAEAADRARSFLSEADQLWGARAPAIVHFGHD